MKIIYIGLWKNMEQPAVELCSERDMSSFSRFTRGTITQFIDFYSETIAGRTKPGQRADVEEQGHIVHSYARSEGVCGIIVCDQEYPSMVAHQLLSRILDDFLTKHPVSSFRTTTAPKSILFPELKDYITKYQNPENADSLMKIQKELDETKVVLHKTIEQMLDRGEKIEALADKSDRLVGNSSEMFKKAKAQNSCCTVM